MKIRDAFLARHPDLPITRIYCGLTAEQWAERIRFKGGKPYWRSMVKRTNLLGKLAGTIDAGQGHRKIDLGGGAPVAKSHLLAWFMRRGWLPKNRRGKEGWGIMARDGDKDNARMSNLACVPAGRICGRARKP